MISNADALSSVENDWWDLWLRSPAATVFQSPAWLIPWWQIFEPGSLRMIAIYQGKRLVGLAPLFVRYKKGAPWLFPLGRGISDYTDILVDAECRSTVLKEMAITVVTLRPAWTHWEMPQLAPDAVTLTFPCPDGATLTEELGVACPALCLPDQASSLKDVVPARMWRNVRVATNRIERHGKHTILQAHDREPKWWAFQLRRLHGARWNAKGKPGVLEDDRKEQFHAEAIGRLTKRGLVRLFALKLDDDVAGIYYGFHHRRCASYYLGGFNPASSYYRVGIFLFAHAITSALREGADIFDFLRGGDAYKYDWGARDKWNQRRLISRPQPWTTQVRNAALSVCSKVAIGAGLLENRRPFRWSPRLAARGELV